MNRPVIRTAPPGWLAELWYVMRHLFAAALFAVAAIVVAAHVLLRYLEVGGLGAAVWAWSIAVFVSAAVLGWLCLPDRPRWRRRDRPIPAAAGAVPVEVDTVPARWDGVAAELERLWESPTLLPPHEYRLRPAVPPADHPDQR